MRRIFMSALAALILVFAFGAADARADAVSTSSAAQPSPTQSPQAASTGPDRHCRIVLAKLKPGEKASRVLSRTCADRKEDLAINEATVLMTWYEHKDFLGLSTYVEGDYGPCDSEGYAIMDTGSAFDPWWPYWWRNNISSFRVLSNCYNTVAWEGTNLGGYRVGAWVGSRAYVGDVANDKIRSLTIKA